jgi:hypothetical protein
MTHEPTDVDLLKLWSVRRIVAAIAVVPWAYLACSGYDLCYGPHVRAVAGYPNQAQVNIYVILPLVAIVVSIALTVLANRIPIWVASIAFCIQVFGLIPVLALWSGGI